MIVGLFSLADNDTNLGKTLYHPFNMLLKLNKFLLKFAHDTVKGLNLFLQYIALQVFVPRV